MQGEVTFRAKENDRYPLQGPRGENLARRACPVGHQLFENALLRNLRIVVVTFSLPCCKLVASDDRYSRYGAAEALGHVGRQGNADDCVLALLEAFESEDLTLRTHCRRCSGPHGATSTSRQFPRCLNAWQTQTSKERSSGHGAAVSLLLFV